jgi:hypothetical protein
MTDFPHLPPGHEPGIQSLRNRVGIPFWEILSAIVGVGMLLGGTFVAAGGRGPAFDRTEELWGGLFLAVVGLIVALWAYFQFRSRKPISLSGRLPGTRLLVDRQETRRGDELTATLDMARPRDGLEVGIVCVERYDYLASGSVKGARFAIRQSRDAIAFEDWQPVEPIASEHRYTFAIPHDAPYSWEGECVTFAWRVSARVARKLRSDPRIDSPIWVRW